MKNEPALQRLNQIGSRLFDYPFEKVENQRGLHPRNQLIPTQLFQTWEENSFGRRHARAIRKFRKINADLDFIFFSANERLSYLEQNWAGHPITEIYRKAKFGPMKADIFRYCIVYERGGYYFDISKGMKVAITSLHGSGAEAFLSFEGNNCNCPDNPILKSRLLLPNNCVIQWGFGFSAKSKVLKTLIESIVENYPNFVGKVFENPKEEIVKLTGPLAMTKALHATLIQNPEFAISQSDVDFGGNGIYALPGAGARHRKYPSYAAVRNTGLFN